MVGISSIPPGAFCGFCTATTVSSGASSQLGCTKKPAGPTDQEDSDCEILEPRNGKARFLLLAEQGKPPASHVEPLRDPQGPGPKGERSSSKPLVRVHVGG